MAGTAIVGIGVSNYRLRKMRFLDLDLDFFLNEEVCCDGCGGSRSELKHKPWSAARVRRFLEGRCGLSIDAPVPGRTVETHDRALDFWRMLIESGKLRVPFEVVHVDAHPDICVVDGLYLKSGFLYVDCECGLAVLGRKKVHPGNYLTFAVIFGWLGSIVWVTPGRYLKDTPRWWNGDARSGTMQLDNGGSKSLSIRVLAMGEKGRCIGYTMLSWHKFKTSEPFDYIVLSRSPESTPSESNALVSVIEGYIKQT